MSGFDQAPPPLQPTLPIAAAGAVPGMLQLS